MRSHIRPHQLILAIAACLATSASIAQVRAVYDQGTGALARQLQRLQTTASVMHTGAHPDDEDSALVAYHARREHARTAYLSLTRGSGGQNIIGPEQSDLLGVIRTEELLQARRLDGAEQYFTRAVDFGFSKHRAEAARMWDTDPVLGDMVRTIRQFRPRVLISRWQGTPADGHGHHQYAGHLTPLAYVAAADPDRYPQHLADGLQPWQADKLYVMARSDDQPKPASVDTGEYDPITGRSYFEIGMQGRSQQKTQQMGQLELRGSQASFLRLVESQVSSANTPQNLFTGIDTSIAGIAGFQNPANRKLRRLLHKLQFATAEALEDYNAFAPELLIPQLANALSLAREARALADSYDAERLLDEKISELESALIMAAGITVDALANVETINPGGQLAIAVRVYDADQQNSQHAAVELTGPDGWRFTKSQRTELPNETSLRRKERADFAAFFDVSVARNAAPTEPYWMRRPRQAFLYDWSSADGDQTLPFSAPLLVARVSLNVGGEPVVVSRSVQFRTVDRIRGELRRQLEVVPDISVSPVGNLIVIPIAAPTDRYAASLTIRNHSPKNVSGEARFNMPDGWTVEPADAAYSLPPQPASTTLRFDIMPPPGLEPGTYQARASASLNGATYRQSMQEIAYPHIDTHRIYETANIAIKAVDVRIAPVRIGYVMGSGDTVPAALARLGVDVTLLDDNMLTAGNLQDFDTIVVGIRASQTRPAFVANNARLLEFARNGGALIVQYQQSDYIQKGLAPFAAEMDRAVRVVDETAAVTILQPDHPAFNFPNAISSRDFDGWVQERNNHNFTRFDTNRYVPLTESHDEGEADSIGGMVYAPIGNGHYVYTGYSWFRQLPNGVPGAYRLFANLLSLPAADD